MSHGAKTKSGLSNGKVKVGKQHPPAMIYGEEGSNKTMPKPQPDAQPSDELIHTTTRFIPKSPYTRG